MKFSQRLDNVRLTLSDKLSLSGNVADFIKEIFDLNDGTSYTQWKKKGILPLKKMKILQENHNVNPRWLNEGVEGEAMFLEEKGGIVNENATLYNIQKPTPEEKSLKDKLTEANLKYQDDNRRLQDSVDFLKEENRKLREELGIYREQIILMSQLEDISAAELMTFSQEFIALWQERKKESEK